MPVTNARVVFLVALSLLVLLPSLSLQDRVQTSNGFFPDQYETATNGPDRSKWNENNNFSGPPNRNKWEDGDRGPPGPPGLTGGSPPGLNDKHPSGWNKMDTKSSSEDENYPHNYPNNGGSTQKPHPNYNREDPRGPDSRVSNARNVYSNNYSNNSGFIQRPHSDYDRDGVHSPNDRVSDDQNVYSNNYSSNSPPGLNGKHPPDWNKDDTENSSEGKNYPHNYSNNGGSTQRPHPNYNREDPRGPDSRVSNAQNVYSNNYSNNSGFTQKPHLDYDRESVHSSNDRVSDDRNVYPNNYSNNSGFTQRPHLDYDREGLRGPDDRVSDNRNANPQSRQCREDEFRCGSNECLPRSVKCDNRVDCRDASDEESCSVNRNQKNGCVLPEQPEGGHYELSDCDYESCTKRPGDMVLKNSILNYTCKSNYALIGNTISVCVDNEWYQPPSCRKVCPSLNSTSVDISCSYQGETVSCSERIMPGTRATLACKSSYKLPLTNDPAYREITCLDDGLWDRRLFRCLPECGISTARGKTLIVNGFQAKVGIFPWHVGIYAKEGRGEYQQICGGTLISYNLVVSAAHCFYDEAYDRLYDASKYAVAIGKHYRNWNAIEKYAQQSLIESIEAGGRYQGARGNFADDIALLKLKTPFELTALVMPVCIDWDNAYEREQLQVGHAGKVVGWGRDIKGESSKSLQEIDMPFVSYDQCLSVVPVDFRGYLTSDKFCAGRLNGSSACDGDSGGGLCFEKDGIWYLRGVVSVSPENKGTCDYNSYVGFTSVSHFRDWLREAYVNS